MNELHTRLPTVTVPNEHWHNQ